MTININNLVSLSDANRNFSKLARMVDENGAAVILRNNVPRYVLLEISQFQKEEFPDNATVQEIGEAIVKKHLPAFKELAK